MSAGFIVTFVVKQGRRDELLAVLPAGQTWAEGHGADVRVRASVVSGPESGRISITQLFEDPGARGAYMDAVTADAANNPTLAMVNSADPPATPVSRVFFNEVGGAGGIPANAPLQTATIFASNPAQRDEARAALAAATERWAGLGVESRNFQIVLSGSAPGTHARVLAFDSWAAYETATAANVALDAPPPILGAVASGALTVLSSTSSVAVAL